jgi:hypothetical protein
MSSQTDLEAAHWALNGGCDESAQKLYLQDFCLSTPPEEVGRRVGDQSATSDFSHLSRDGMSV